MTRLLLAIALALQAAPHPTPQQQYAQTILDLGTCQQERSRYQAAVVVGALLDAAGVKAKIEALNPEYVFDPQTFKVTLKPKTE